MFRKLKSEIRDELKSQLCYRPHDRIAFCNALRAVQRRYACMLADYAIGDYHDTDPENDPYLPEEWQASYLFCVRALDFMYNDIYPNTYGGTGVSVLTFLPTYDTCVS